MDQFIRFSGSNDFDEITNVPKDWLHKRTSLEEVLAGLDGLPFDDVEFRQSVTEIASKMGPTDELWGYRSSDESWERMCGTAGFAIVRDGEIISAYQTIMN